ncbi:MAG: TatD family hydrolase, partial [Opitutales bacterium]|nr:TatD family hydrolase [Opitutales bacterium]
MNRISSTGRPPDLYDAHLHLTDSRLSPFLADIVQTMIRTGIRGCVSNSTGVDDWESILSLASAHSWIRPAIGVHPWRVSTLHEDWYPKWVRLLDFHPDCLIGEIGLDLGIRDPDISKQRKVFRLQITAAAERRIPPSIHCVRAWNELHAEMKSVLPLRSGFLLHAFNGPSESVLKWSKAGAYFSVSPRETKHLNSSRIGQLRQIPIERILIETDAPNVSPTDNNTTHQLIDPNSGKRLNHPADLSSTLIQLARILEHEPHKLAAQIASNYHTLFGTSAE